MKLSYLRTLIILAIVSDWLQNVATGQSSQELATTRLTSSENCIVHKVKFTMTEGSLRRSRGEFCGNLTGVCCSMSLSLNLGESDILVNNRRGNLAEPREPVASIGCRPNVRDFGVTDITWVVLQDVYGLDAIKNNEIPSGCLMMKNVSPASKASTQPKTDPTHEQRVILDALDDAHGNTAVAAKKLGISERALLRKMGEYKIKRLRR